MVTKTHRNTVSNKKNTWLNLHLSRYILYSVKKYCLEKIFIFPPPYLMVEILSCMGTLILSYVDDYMEPMAIFTMWMEINSTKYNAIAIKGS